MNEPNLVIVDLNRFVERQKDTQLVQGLQKFLTIYDIIKLVLTFDQYTGTGNAFWHLLEEKAPEVLTNVDHDLLEITLESFTLDLDEYIRRKVPVNFDTSFYIFHQWLPPTSLIIKNGKDQAIIYTDRKPCQNAAGEYVSVRDFSRDRFDF